MNAHWKDFQESFQQRILGRLEELLPEMGHQGISNSLWSLAVMSFPPNHLVAYPGILSGISRAVERDSHKFNAKSLSTTYYSLSKLLGNGVHDESARKILDSLEKITLRIHRFKSIEVANIIYGLGRLGAPISSNLTACLVVSFVDSISQMSEQELGNSIWGLFGQLGVDYSSLPLRARSEIIASIIVKGPQLRRQALVAILQSFGKMHDISWDELPRKLKRSLTDTINRLFPPKDINIKDEAVANEFTAVSNVFQSLAMMRVQEDAEMIKGVVERVFGAYLTYLGRANLFDVVTGSSASCYINSLAKLDANWHDLSSSYRKDIQRLLSSTVKRMSAKEYASVLWSIATLEYRHDHDSTLLDPLETHVQQMSGYELAWSIWSMGRLSVFFADLSPACQQNIITRITQVLPQMDRQEVTVTLWGFGKMKVPVNDLSDEIRVSILTTLEQM